MAKVIGPSFESELRAAGVLGLPFSYDNNGLYMTALTPAQQATLQAVYDAHNSATPRPDADKDRELDAFLDSVAATVLKAVLLSVRDEINTVRAALPTPLPAITVVSWRNKVKVWYRTLVS